MHTVTNVALIFCLFVLFFDLFGQFLGPYKVIEAVLAALAATTLAGIVSMELMRKLT